MRKLIFLLTAICLCSVIPIKASDILHQADSAYTADNFQEAAAAYQHVIKEEGTSAEILYNLGNCYYRMGELGKAILSYERALRLDPTFDDARNNLEFVNSKIADRAGERGTFMGNALDSVANSAKSNTWSWLAFAFFVITLTGVVAYIFSSQVAVRKIGFFGGIVAFIACLCFIFLAFRSASIAMADDVAIQFSAHRPVSQKIVIRKQCCSTKERECRSLILSARHLTRSAHFGMMFRLTMPTGLGSTPLQ